ncbi:hypothetical protein K435DRAFT_857409 [Dendrothele bispora CBS 962.96]|uniref:Proteophosphoglycan ppg4 n=1 Tax=Dendrothele bispora (strain CBS 962.96) TaxID=1314807 RepID=A0A4S8M5U9_DENBC|nr:hypothetical protein K435DRAFT_857409 [Dendrothele bispora CBS 962.96]
MTPSNLFVLALYWSFAGAAPLSSSTDEKRRRWRTSDGIFKRASPGDSDGNSSSTRIWVPIIAVVLVVLGVLAVLLAKRGSNFVHYFARAAGNETGAPVTTVLTADQLTGGASNTDVNTTTNGDATRPRRNRRPRRTPSQISTTSLPAYMKEPGEQELVVIRGPQDMEDVPLHAVEMPSVNEDEDSVNSRYSPVPQSPHDMPLLQNDEEAAAANTSGPNAATQARASDETGSGSEDSISLARVETTRTDEPVPDPRGATPSYFEAVDLGEDRPAAPATTASPEASTAAAPANPANTRRSTFRLSNLFGNRGGTIRGSSRANPPPGLPFTSDGPSHTRGDSGGALSLTSIASRQSGPNGHRPSQSNGSLLSLVRKKSSATLNSNHLNSPSMISLNSISSPLTHTLMRTEFTYPKSGPTPEQLKLISSRDSFARFGVPYGPDAIAYASSSRADLSNPPPEFDASEGPASSSSPRPGSRLRAIDLSGDDQEDHADSSEGEPVQGTNENTSLAVETPAVHIQASTPSGSPTIPPAAPAAVSQLTEPSPSTASNVVLPSTETSSSATPSSTVPGSTTPANDARSSSVSNEPTELTSTPSVSGSSSSEVSSLTDASDTNTIRETNPTSSSNKPPITSSIPAAGPTTTGSLSSKPTSNSTSLSSKAPPTSFKAPVSTDPNHPNYPYPESRAESRASSFRSVQSFATAHESMRGHNEFGAMSSEESESESVYHSEYHSGDETERDSDQETVDERSRPGTPTLATRHVVEATDATVRPTPT